MSVERCRKRPFKQVAPTVTVLLKLWKESCSRLLELFKNGTEPCLCLCAWTLFQYLANYSKHLIVACSGSQGWPPGSREPGLSSAGGGWGSSSVTLAEPSAECPGGLSACGVDRGVLQLVILSFKSLFRFYIYWDSVSKFHFYRSLTLKLNVWKLIFQ